MKLGGIKKTVQLGLALLTCGIFCWAQADSTSTQVKLRPVGAVLTKAVQDALAAISTPDFQLTLDNTSGPVLSLGGSGASAAPFNPDIAVRVVTVGVTTGVTAESERRLEFNPQGPLPLVEALSLTLAAELGLKEWTTKAARARLSGADLNADGIIDLSDLAILMENYGKSTGIGDFNQDRKVDDADLKLFSQQYGF